VGGGGKNEKDAIIPKKKNTLCQVKTRQNWAQEPATPSQLEREKTTDGETQKHVRMSDHMSREGEYGAIVKRP